MKHRRSQYCFTRTSADMDFVTTATIEDYKIKTCRESSGGGGRNLLRQRLQLEDGETGFISGQRGGFDDACKLKTMFTK